MENIRILIADDHPIVRAGLEGMISRQPDMEVIGEAADGKETVALADKLKPDVILMDLRMPGVDGVSATEEIKAKQPDIHILVLTTYDSDADILRAIEAGATGYMLKDAPREELHEAVRATAQGKVLLASAVADKLMQHIRQPRNETLSGREIEVLALVRQGLSNKDIARTLHVSEATVKTHLIHTFRKLDVADRTAAVNVALEQGILRLEK